MSDRESLELCVLCGKEFERSELHLAEINVDKSPPGGAVQTRVESQAFFFCDLCVKRGGDYVFRMLGGPTVSPAAWATIDGRMYTGSSPEVRSAFVQNALKSQNEAMGQKVKSAGIAFISLAAFLGLYFLGRIAYRHGILLYMVAALIFAGAAALTVLKIRKRRAGNK